MPAKPAITADRSLRGGTSGSGDPSATPRTVREHERLVRACTACDLHRDRANPVVGDGPVEASLVVVGGVPRRYEDLHGKALSGGARNVLDTALLAAGFDPGQVRVTSAVRCRPFHDRAATVDELSACGAHLRAELAMIAPRVVVSLGALPTAVLLGRRIVLERVAGYRLDILDGTTLVPTYHPNDAVRGDPQAGPALQRDLGVAKAVIDGRMRTGAQAIADLRARLDPPA